MLTLKNILYILLTLTLLLGLTTACGQGAIDQPNNEAPPLESTPQEAEQEKKASETEISANDPSNPVIEIAILNKIFLYYADDQLMSVYRVEEDAQYPINEEGIRNALQRWIEGPVNDNLISLVPKTVIVQSVQFHDDIVSISFSPELFEANLGSTGEGMIVEQIAMVVEQFGFNEVLLLIDGEVIDTLLGHVDWSEPFVANSPEDYELYSE